MKDGTIDAMFWSGGLPTPGITDLFTTRRDAVTFLDITPQLPKMQKSTRSTRRAPSRPRPTGRRPT